MTQPTPYVRSYSFTNHQTSNPSLPLPGNKVDEQLNAVAQSVGEICDNLALIQRDDTKLANTSVHKDALNADVLALITAGGMPRGEWVTSMAYAIKDLVAFGGRTYIAVTAHTSGAFATDLAAGKWLLFAPSVVTTFNVKDYGARGDGTGDDRDAVHRARDAMLSAGGGVVYFPPSRYRISKYIQCNSGTGIGFVGGPGVIIDNSNVSAGFERDGIRVGEPDTADGEEGSNDGTRYVRDVVVRGFKFANCRAGVRAVRVKGGLVADIVADGVAAVAIGNDGTDDCFQIDVRNIRMAGWTLGPSGEEWYIVGAYRTTDLTIDGIYQDAGMTVTPNAAALTITSCTRVSFANIHINQVNRTSNGITITASTFVTGTAFSVANAKNGLVDFNGTLAGRCVLGGGVLIGCTNALVLAGSWSKFHDLLTMNSVTADIAFDDAGSGDNELHNCLFNGGQPAAIVEGSAHKLRSNRLFGCRGAGEGLHYGLDARPGEPGWQIAEGRRMNVNGEPRVWQQGTLVTTSTVPNSADGTYGGPDCWCLLSDGNGVVDLNQDSDGSLRAIVRTINKQWGYAIFLEGDDCNRILSGTDRVAVQLQAKASGIAKLRAAILSWSGTKDSITRDVVGNWAGGGTTPTFAANWTLEGSVVDLTLSGAYQTLRMEGANAPLIDTASVKQIMLFMWVDDTDGALNDTLNVRRVQIEAGRTCTPFEFRPTRRELLDCRRYIWVWGPGGGGQPIGAMWQGLSNDGRAILQHYGMRVAPTITAVANLQIDDAEAAIAVTAVAVAGGTNQGPDQTDLILTMASSAANQPGTLTCPASKKLTANAYL